MKKYEEEKKEKENWNNELIQKAIDEHSNDNITVILLHLY